MSLSPYIEPPTIPEGTTLHEYRINRPPVRVSALRRMLRVAVR
jgi:hypothetical protein